MLGNVGLNLLVPQFPHQCSGWGEPSPSGEQFGVCALPRTVGTGLGRTHRASEHQEWCVKPGWNLHQRALIPACVLHLLVVKRPWFVSVHTRVPGACPEQSPGHGRGPKAQPGRGGSSPGDCGMCPPLICPCRCCPIKCHVCTFLSFHFSVSVLTVAALCPSFLELWGWAGLSCFPREQECGRGLWGQNPPCPLLTAQTRTQGERSEGFFLWSKLFINAICNEARLVPGALSLGLVEGGVCLRGTPDPACARYQLHLTLLRRSRSLLVLPVPSGHRSCWNPSPGRCSSVGRDAAAQRWNCFGIWV